jgi:hypothetical protein
VATAALGGKSVFLLGEALKTDIFVFFPPLFVPILAYA